MIVDVQHHFVPLELAERRGFARGERRNLIEGGLPKFTLHDTLYDLDAQLRDMDAAGIDVAVLTCNLGWDAPLEDCRLINDRAAEIQRRSGGRFVALAHAPVLDEAGLREVARAVRDLGLHGVTIASQVGGRSLDAPELRAFYRTACALDAAVFVHPAQLPAGYAHMQEYDLARILGRELDLQVAVTRVIAGGVLDAFPDLRLVFAHFGGGIAAIRERLAAKSGRFGTLTRPFDESFERLYFDLAGFEGGAIALRSALDGIRHDRLVFATDYPQDFTGATTQSGKGPDAIRDYVALVGEAAGSAGDARAILGETAASLFRITRRPPRSTAAGGPAETGQEAAAPRRTAEGPAQTGVSAVMTAGAALPERLADLLRAGAPAIVLSVGADGFGHAAMTWAVAPTHGLVRFIVDRGSTTEANLHRNGRASLQVVGPDDVLALLKGPARERRARIEAAPFPMAMWEMTVAHVKDQSWGPVAVAPLTYQWRGPEAEALRRVEQAVLAELREG